MDNLEDIVKTIGDKIESRNLDTEKKFEAMETRARELEQKLSAFSMPNFGDEARLVSYRSIADALVKGERRSITSADGAGSVNVVSNIITEMMDGGKLLPKVATFYGANAKTVVPVFVPRPVNPSAFTEGGTFSADTAAKLVGKELQLSPYGSYIPVSRLSSMSTGIDSQINAVWQEVFGALLDDLIAVKLFDTSMTSLATGNNVMTSATTATVTWKDLAKLAKRVKQVIRNTSDAALVVNSDIIADLYSDAAPSALEMEYLRSNTIGGIQVVESSYAPTDLTTGKFVAVAANMKHFALAVANQINIDSIPILGSDAKASQAFIYAAVEPLVTSSFFYLKTK